ncbi:unnamed protein product [Rotaria sp. Silwood2]|nr:unnamed protein product [Rotaria sp. Silwood2]
MAMSNVERIKKYREKIKKDKVKYEAVKAKDRIRYNSKKQKLTRASLAEFRTENKLRQQKYREHKKKRLVNKPPPSSVRSRQSFDDISYQLPGKKDTIVNTDDDGSRVTYQKRILFNNLRETYKLFKEENDNVYVSRSSFAELRPTFVIPKAALTHRNCLCLYHENICLLLKALDKYVAGKCCASLQTFTNRLVYSTNNEECMFSSCSLCEDFFTEKIQENVSDDNAKIAWSQWINENIHAEKKEFSGNVDEAGLLLQSKVEYFCFMCTLDENSRSILKN